MLPCGEDPTDLSANAWNARDDEQSRVVDWRRAPVTYQDLVRYFRETYSQEMADALIADLETTPHPGETWSSDILLGIARFSPEHRRRIQEYLRWSDERMADEMKK
jgi:hypothetical protein